MSTGSVPPTGPLSATASAGTAVSFKRSIVFTFLTQAPTLLLYFVSSTLITRLLGDVGRGEYALLTTQVALLAMLVSFNVGFGVTFFTSRAGAATHTVVGTACTILLIDLVAVPLMLWGVSTSTRLTEVLMPSERTHWAYWGFVYLSVILSVINGSVSAVLLGLKRFKTLNWMGILNAGLSVVAFLLLYLLRDRVEPDRVLPVLLLVSAAAMLIQTLTWIGLYVVDVGIVPRPVWSWTLLRPILAFSLVGHVSNLINLINYRFDIWVVGDLRGASELGHYTVAVGVAQLLFYIPEPFSRVVQPYLFGQLKDEMLARFKVVARLNFTAVFVLAIALAATAHWMLPLLFGEVFSASVIAIYLLLPGVVFSSTSKMLVPLMVHGGWQRINLYAISVAAVITIALDLLLIPRFGIAGAAVASSLAYLVILLSMLSVIRFRMGIAVHDLFLLRPSDIPLFGNLVAGTPPIGPASVPIHQRPTGRVLCVVGWWPTGSDVAGVFIKEHIQAIRTVAQVVVVYAKVEKGHGLRPIVRHWTRVEDELTVYHIRISTPLRRFGISEFLVRGAYKRLFNKLHREDPFSLVHIHVRTEVTEEVIAATQDVSLPVVVTEHSSFYHLGIRSLPSAEQQRQRRSITQWFKSPRIIAVMPVSHDLSNVLVRDFGVPANKINVVPNIAASCFNPTTTPADTPYRMVLAAVWRPPKDHDVFIRAMLLVPRVITERCRIDWVGYGPDMERIRERCRTELPHVDIRFPGYMDKEALARQMQNAHLFVLPTTADNLPCVVIESLCCGTPVLSMAVNGLPELVHAGNGLLVPPSDPKALATAIQSCVEGVEFDRDAISSEALAKYSPAAVVDRILETYRWAFRS